MNLLKRIADLFRKETPFEKNQRRFMETQESQLQLNIKIIDSPSDRPVITYENK